MSDTTDMRRAEDRPFDTTSAPLPGDRPVWTARTAWAASSRPARLAATSSVVAIVAGGVAGDVPPAAVVAIVLLVPPCLVDLVDRRLPTPMIHRAAVAWTVVHVADHLVGRAAASGHGGDGVGRLVAAPALGALLLGGALLVLHVVSPDAMGFGDVRLGTVLGAAVGPVDVRLALVVACVASLGAAAAGIARRRRHVAFGPALLGAAILVLVAASSTSDAAGVLARPMAFEVLGE